MISSVSPLPGLLVPPASAPVAGDPAAFGLMLAEAGGMAIGAATGRQIAASTGKAVPPPADLLSPTTGSPIPSVDEEPADASPPVPTIPAALAAGSPKPAIAPPRPTTWPRFAEPEACAVPAGEPPVAESETEETDPDSPRPPTPAIDCLVPAAIGPVPDAVERDRIAGLNGSRAPDPALRAAPTPVVASLEALPRTDASGRDAPVASGDPPLPDMVDEHASPIAAPARAGSAVPASVTAGVPDARPILAPAADPVREREAARASVAPMVPALLADRPAPVIALPTGSASGQAAVVPPSPSPMRSAINAASLPTPAASPAVPANPVVGPAVEQVPETATPSLEPRPDAAKPPAPDRLPTLPIPVASGGPVPTAARAVLSGPARQVFAADLRRTGRDLRPVAGETLMVPVETAAVGTTVAAPVAAPLDLRQDRWPSAMVERIERLRDAVESERIGADTRIRLIPDALGSIEVAVKRDGDTVHVRFTAEQAATRALLGDAAPRLAEAAEARGLKLGQTAVGGDGSQPGGRQPQPQTDTAPARPRPAATPDEDATDTRIA